MDSGLAESVAELLRESLHLEHKEIRCTSVDGYRLRGGDSPNAELPEEVRDAELLVCVITPAALKSEWVELEARVRREVNRRLIPVVGAGARTRDLSALVGDLNALDLSNESQVLQLVLDAGQELLIKPRSPPTYVKKVHAVVELAGGPPKGDLSEQAADLLKKATSPGPEHFILVISLASYVAFKMDRESFRLDRDTELCALYLDAVDELEVHGLIRLETAQHGQRRYRITGEGYKVGRRLNET